MIFLPVEGPPVLSDRFRWTEEEISQDRFYWIYNLNKI